MAQASAAASLGMLWILCTAFCKAKGCSTAHIECAGTPAWLASGISGIWHMPFCVSVWWMWRLTASRSVAHISRGDMQASALDTLYQYRQGLPLVLTECTLADLS